MQIRLFVQGLFVEKISCWKSWHIVYIGQDPDEDYIKSRIRLRIRKKIVQILNTGAQFKKKYFL
jgi:hypothetical protein